LYIFNFPMCVCVCVCVVGHVIDSGIGLSITIDKIRAFINKTLSILSVYQ
jgi:hypothetical protein